MARPRPDLTHRVAVIDPNFESRERVRSMLAHDQCTCIAASDASDIVAMSARARRFTWGYLVCDGPVEMAERQIASLRRAIAPDLPLLVAVPVVHVDEVTALLGPRDAVLGLPCAGLQLAARLVDFARLHQPRPRPSAALDRESTAALHLQTGRWWR
jgi:hypothetical protein